ncbi:hypothetical protein [Tropicibacter sp. S64]|uniref:hypothetical protein n=1 Tax=Tropicibacter sp. S64 TaxID=3415122 RepID=UPI003C7CFB57
MMKKTIKLGDFKSPIDADSFASGLMQLPKLTDAMRIAGLRDGTGMAQAKVVAAERAALRAKLRDDPVAEARAEKARADAKALSDALEREVTRVTTGLAGTLKPEGGGKPKKDTFTVSGTLMTIRGLKMHGVTVRGWAGKRKEPFEAVTSEEGVFTMAVPIGEDSAVSEGDTLHFEVVWKKETFSHDGFPVLTVAAGGKAEVVLTMPNTNAPKKDPGKKEAASKDPAKVRADTGLTKARRANARLNRLIGPWDILKK